MAIARIHHQHTERTTEGSLSGRRKSMPDGNTDLCKEMKNIRNVTTSVNMFLFIII